MEFKRTEQLNSKMKNLKIENHQIIDENGEIINLIKTLEKAYGDNYFDLSVACKSEELITYDVFIDNEDETEEE